MDLKEFYIITKRALESLQGTEPLDFRLEQVEYEKANNQWDVVVSYLVKNQNKRDHSLLEVSGWVTDADLEYERVYKSLKIDQNKEVVGFHMFTKAF